MKSKFLNLLLLATSLLGYLEWGADNKSFLFEAEYEVFRQMFTDPKNLAHPFVFLPILGQLLILVTFLQKNPNRILVYSGIACLGLLLGFMFFIGLLEMNYKILISTLPFMITAIFIILNLRKLKAQQGSTDFAIK